jgi:U3 small nucleolar RNA-associated protein 25
MIHSTTLVSWISSSSACPIPPSVILFSAFLSSFFLTNALQLTTESITPLQTSLLTHLSTYSDLFHPSITLGAPHSSLRSAASLHAMNHVLKTRSRVLKNNDALARAAADPDAPSMTRNTQDQGFTRPKVLVLLPFRNSAKEWVDALTSLSGAESVENKARFDAEYSLPEGATDKLEENPENYAEDHVNTFKGNIDDSFRVGLKVTRKTVKLYSEFYSADVIVASPLGLRTSIEKEK